MKRLTTNKEVCEMDMVELAHNSCHIKNGCAWLRDYETDTDARELTRKLLKQYAKVDDAFTCAYPDFDEYILDCLSYGTDTIEGLIALFYRNLWAMTDLYERLKHYEDLEEQGLLLKLLCKVGDTVWELCKCDDGVYRTFPMKVTKVMPYGSIRWVNGKEPSVWNIYAVSDYTDMYKNFYDFGRTVFRTQAEAEEALKKDE